MLSRVLPPDLSTPAETLLASCRAAGLKLATAESCTGGLLAALLTSVPGSSEVFERGFVTYSNESKIELLGVEPALLAQHGAVSVPTAGSMAEGALAHSRADLSVAITGIAGPGGGTAEKPVGLVYLATCRRGEDARVFEEYFSGTRAEIRAASVARALALLRERLRP